MSARLRALAALLAFTLSAQAAAPAFAWADGFDDPIAGVCTIDDAVTSAPPAGTFGRLVYDYISAYNSDNRVYKAIYASRIRKSIFAHPGSQEYIDHLQYIDSQVASSPDAVYDLAKSLQLHWEAQYALGLGERRARRVGTGMKVGAVIGMAIAGVAMFMHPEKAPRYFSFMRRMWPLIPLAAPVGVVVGHEAGRAVSGFLEQNVPISPAHVMHLGITTDDLTEDDNTLLVDLSAITAGIAAGEAFTLIMRGVRAAELVNEAATPAKINPYVLIGSIILTVVVDWGVRRGADAYEMHHLTSRFEGARNVIDWAIGAQDDAQLYTGADALVSTSTNLANYINHPILEAIQEYTSNVGKAAHDLGEGTQAYQDRLSELTESFSGKVREALGDQDRETDDDYQSILVLGFLSHHDEDSVNSLGDTAATLARAYQSGFDPWLAQAENQRQVNLAESGREQVFRTYIQGLMDAKYRQLAREFRAGVVPRNANHVLLEAAGLLRSTGKEYVEDQADFLLSMIARNNMLLSQSAASDPGADGGTAP